MTEANIPATPQPTMAELERAWEAWRMNWEVMPRHAHAELESILQEWHGQQHADEVFRVVPGDTPVLVNSVGRCTCGAGGLYAHEPMCGWELLGYVQPDGSVK
jgi:hypothetical protein